MYVGISAIPTSISPVEFSVSETAITIAIGNIECATTSPVPPPPTFTIENNNVPFQLIGLGNSIIARLERTEELDYDTGPSNYTFLVTCSDSSGSISEFITVILLPENDNFPEYSTEPDIITICETAPIGTVVASQGSNGLAHITVSDNDKGEDGILTFKFASTTNDYEMNETDGTILLTKQLDVDIDFIASEILGVLVCDGDRVEIMCKFVNLQIVINPVNEFDPQFSQSSYTTIDPSYIEGEYNNLVIATVICTDMDKGLGIVDDIQLIDSVIPLKLVELSDESADIILNGTIDYDVIRISEIVVSLKCSDNGQPSKADYANIIFHIEDVDDNIPQFTRLMYNELVEEIYPVGGVILIAECNDNDYGVGSLVGIELLNPSSDVTNTFVINAVSGEIRLNRSLDYDSDLKLSYIFNVVCIDSAGNVAIADVNITILPVNDEPVLFNSSEYDFTVNRLELLGVVVGQVVASDRDVDTIQHITYSIEHNPHFDINSDGDIIMENFILFLQGDYFNVTVTASDGVNNDSTTLVIVRVNGYLSVLDIVFIIVGLLLVLAVVIIVIVVCCCRRMKKVC